MYRLLRLGVAAAVALSLAGCGGESSGTSGKADAAHPMELTLAHGLSETHTVHIAMKHFADEVSRKTGGRIRIKIFANGQLGNETEQMEQVMAGVISMTKVSAPMLATYNDAFHTFGLPYIFQNTKDFYKVMNSPQMYDFFKSTYPSGFVVLTYYTSGARSFYTPNKAIRNPSDLKGMKIRVMDMKSQTEMIRLMGGTPVAMAYGDVYTSLQTGVIDGTENNETALTTGKHGEICKVYSTDQHAMIPDVLLISSKVWDRISDEDRKIMVDAARESTRNHAVEWDKAIDSAIAEARDKMGVTFVNDVDKAAFRKATEPMLASYSAEYPGVRKLLSLIVSVRNE
jgi:tripartite ATP-independent transporter DctP family solute receptor